MPGPRTNYRVFVASPGDVARERQIAREVIRSVSDRLGNHGGFTLEPVGWETHAAIDAGRPQALINPLVRECDVFVGILWSRFGTDTGEAESGTAEEFAEALKVRAETGDRPKMMVFFSNSAVPMERLQDPEGLDQFKKAQEFRKGCESGSGLAVNYRDVFEFERSLYEQLVAWCAKRSAATVPAPVVADTSGLRQEYLNLLFNFHKDLPVAGFGEAKLRIPIDLESVFVPVRTRIAALDRELHGHRPERGVLESNEAVGDFSSAWDFAARKDIRLLVVLGQPGSGKTTLLKHLALVCASDRSAQLGLSEETLPILVPLRQLSIEDDFAVALRNASEPPLRDFPPNFFASFLGDRALILLDGLDEVADEREREKVSRWIEQLSARHPQNRIVATSRYAGYQTAPLRAGHLQIDIERFGPDGVRAFLNRWYRAVETRLHEDAPEWIEYAERQAAALVQVIEEHEEIRVLASNPLMLQIIVLVHRDRGALPDRRVELYEECTNILLEHWDRARGMEVPLTARQARQVLQPLALWMHGETKRVRARAEDVASVISGPLARLPRQVDADEFLRSVRDRSGLLTGHGVDEYGFQHLSFQEYLAAEEIRNTRRLEVLVEHYDESWWREVTRLFVGLGNPNYFDELMRLVASAGKLAGHAGFTGECIRDALAPSAAPFLEALSARPRLRDRIRGWLAGSRSAGPADVLLAMRALPEAEIAGVRERIEAFLRAPEPAVRRAAVDLLIGTGLGGAEAAAAGVDAATNLQRVRVNPLDRGELILVPAGMFKVGSEEDSNNPPREMDLPSFYLARYPVTNAQYRLFLEANPEEAKSRFWDDERFNQDQQPVVHVSWHQAKAYCDWAGARLPTEWEWEKAARGSDGRIFPWGNTQPDESRAAFANPGGVPSPVGSFPAGASPYGHLDMAGNVWEWTALLFEKGEGWRTCRGGCFSHMAALLRASFRLSVLPVDRYIFIGFRCAQDP